MNKSASNIALLIDADNTSFKLIGEIISEAGKYGKVTIRRAYGDFSTDHLKNWKDELNRYAIRPMQKFSYTTGKNSTDSAMIIDAMDIMHDELVNGFCIASSDSDYTGLALRIREEGIFVIGVGKSTTPEAFQKACEMFVFTENLFPQKTEEVKTSAPKKAKTTRTKTAKTAKPERERETERETERGAPVITTVKQETEKTTEEKRPVVSRIDKKPLDLSLIDRAVKMALEDEDLAYMGKIGEKLRTLDPTFDSRSFGFASIATLFKSMPERFELHYKNNGTSLYIKPKLIPM
jgi:uncharacterized LabA/DUF88 family protein